MKTSDYLKIGTEERPEFAKTHNVNTSRVHLIFGMTVLLRIQLKDEMVVWQKYLTLLGPTSMMVLSSTTVKMAVTTKWPQRRSVRAGE